MHHQILFLLLFAVPVSLGNYSCNHSGDQTNFDSGSDAMTDSDVYAKDAAGNDADVDADADSDTDTDADGDTDSDTDSDSGVQCCVYLDWVKAAGGDEIDTGNGVVMLSDGSAIVTGDFYGDAFLGINLTGKGGNDVFLAKYNTNGNLIWATSAGGIDHEWGHKIAATSDDSLIVVGDFYDSATFGEGETNETTLSTDGGTQDRDVFIAKYNPNGTLAWAKKAGGPYNWGLSDTANDISVFTDGSSLITGAFESTATFGEGDATEITLSSAGYYDIFIAKYDPDGTLIRAIREGGAGYENGVATTTLSNASFYMTGTYSDTVVFGEGETNETTIHAAGGSDIFIAKYNQDTELIWVEAIRGNDTELVKDISSFQDGSTIITGEIRSETIFGEGQSNETSLNPEDGNIFIAKYDSDGTLIWAKNYEGASGEGITANSNGSFLVLGWNGPSETPQTGIYIALFDPAGTLKWSRMAADKALAYDMASLDGGTVYLTGSFCDSVFGPGDPDETHLAADCDWDDYDIFIAKFSP